MFTVQTQLPGAGSPHTGTKAPNLCQLSWGSWHGSHVNQRAEHSILFSAPRCSLGVLQPSCCYCRRPVVLHLTNIGLFSKGSPFKSSVRKCFGRRLPNSQEGHTSYLSEISCAMASFSFTNCKSSLKWRHTQKKAMKQLAEWRTSSLC